MTVVAPLAVDDSCSTPENVALNVPPPGVLGNDTNVEPTHVARIQSPPGHGLLAFGADGSISYSPALDFAGTDTFSYCIAGTDAMVPCLSNTATVTITVLAPVAVVDTYTTPMNTALTVSDPGLLANDLNLSSGLTTGIQAIASHGIAQRTLTPGGSFTYTPNSGFAGTHTFTYCIAQDVADAPCLSNTATVTITVVPPNRPPTANSDSFTTTANTALHVPAPGVLANDSDPDGDPLNASLDSPLPAHGMLATAGDGSFDYTPNPGFVGTDSFGYRANDGRGGSDPALVTITVTPVAVDDAYTTPAGTALNVAAPGLLGNDVTNAGNFTEKVLGPPAHGIATSSATTGRSPTHPLPASPAPTPSPTAWLPAPPAPGPACRTPPPPPSPSPPQAPRPPPPPRCRRAPPRRPPQCRQPACRPPRGPPRQRPSGWAGREPPIRQTAAQAAPEAPAESATAPTDRLAAGRPPCRAEPFPGRAATSGAWGSGPSP